VAYLESDAPEIAKIYGIILEQVEDKGA